MNVIVSNEQQNVLTNLDIDIIKSLTGVYDVSEIVAMFKNFFFNKMVLDVTAIKNYDNISNYEILVSGLDPDKIILLLPEGSRLCTPNFLSQLISIGIYNFTTNTNGVKYLLKKSNTLKDVEHIKKMSHIEDSKDSGAVVVNNSGNNISSQRIIGIRNVTEQAGASTLIYMLRKELVFSLGQDNVVAIEIDKNDFSLFNSKNMVSCSKNDIKNFIQKYSDAKIIFIDLNNCSDDSFCNEIFYLVEPSTVKLNRLIRKDRQAFSKLVNKKVILNKSLLLNNDVFDFEGEAGIKIFYNMPPLDERKRNAIINDFLIKIGLIASGKTNNNSNKIFGLFRR